MTCGPALMITIGMAMGALMVILCALVFGDKT